MAPRLRAIAGGLAGAPEGTVAPGQGKRSRRQREILQRLVELRQEQLTNALHMLEAHDAKYLGDDGTPEAG